jgi:hypothetical protein
MLRIKIQRGAVSVPIHAHDPESGRPSADLRCVTKKYQDLDYKYLWEKEYLNF